MLMCEYYRNFPKDLTGLRFGRLLVLSKHTKTDQNIPGTLWLCKCDCGKVSIKKRLCLVTNTSKSCGCLSLELLLKNATKHGKSQTAEYRVWQDMKARCYNKTKNNYSSYGGRGITVCDRWRDSFENFIKDVGIRPSEKHSLERVNNDGNYEPSNVRWATGIEQSNNTRSNRVIVYKNKKMTVAQAAREFGIDHELLRSRLKRGWSPTKAIEFRKLSPREKCLKQVQREIWGKSQASSLLGIANLDGFSAAK